MSRKHYEYNAGITGVIRLCRTNGQSYRRGGTETEAMVLRMYEQYVRRAFSGVVAGFLDHTDRLASRKLKFFSVVLPSRGFVPLSNWVITYFCGWFIRMWMRVYNRFV